MLPSCFCLARSKTHPSLGCVHGWLNCRCQPWFIRNHDNNKKKRDILQVQNWIQLKDIGRIARLVALRCQNWNVMTIESYFFSFTPNHTLTHTFICVIVTLNKHTQFSLPSVVRLHTKSIYVHCCIRLLTRPFSSYTQIIQTEKQTNKHIDFQILPLRWTIYTTG